MKIILGADHRGFKLKEKMKLYLSKYRYDFEDVGAKTFELRDDYPVYAGDVAYKVASNKGTMGIIFCGSGVGVDIAANKINGIRCGLGFNTKQVGSARHDDNINILAIPSDYVNEELAKEMIEKFLKTEFSEEERHERRVGQISDLENDN